MGDQTLTCINSLRHGRNISYTIMRQIAMIRKSIETRTRTTLVSSGEVGSNPSMRSGGRDKLSCRIEGGLPFALLTDCARRGSWVVEDACNVLRKGGHDDGEEAEDCEGDLDDVHIDVGWHRC